MDGILNFIKEVLYEMIQPLWLYITSIQFRNIDTIKFKFNALKRTNLKQTDSKLQNNKSKRKSQEKICIRQLQIFR